jgi:hypothetical protein
MADEDDARWSSRQALENERRVFNPVGGDIG